MASKAAVRFANLLELLKFGRFQVRVHKSTQTFMVGKERMVDLKLRHSIKKQVFQNGLNLALTRLKNHPAILNRQGQVDPGVAPHVGRNDRLVFLQRLANVLAAADQQVHFGADHKVVHQTDVFPQTIQVSFDSGLLGVRHFFLAFIADEKGLLVLVRVRDAVQGFETF